MAIDFSKLSSRTSEEIEAHQVQMERVMVEQELAGRYSLPIARRQIVLSEDPDVRHSMSGNRRAILRGAGEDGVAFYGILNAMPNEDVEFSRRLEDIGKGSTIDVEFHNSPRSWKDHNDEWRTMNEQIIDVVRGPESLKYQLPEGVNEPQSKLEITNLQAQRAAQEMDNWHR